MTIEAKMADGTILRFPAGTSQAVIDRAARQHVMRQRFDTPFARLTSRLANAATFNFGDEAAGVGEVIGNAIAAPLSANVDFDPVGAFNRGKREEQDMQRRAAQDSPTAALLADVAGGLAGVAGAVPRTAGGLWQSIKAGTRAGAAAGGIAGVGSGDGLADRFAKGVVGAGGGALLGGGLALGGGLVGRQIDAARRITGRSNGMAPQIVAGAMQDDGLTGRAAGAAMDAARARGVPLALGDMGENLRGALGAASRQPGPSRTLAREMLDSRQASQADRISAAATRDLGPLVNVDQQSQALQQRARQAAGPLYERAYSEPFNISDDFAQLLTTRLPPQAIANAKELARLEGRNPNQLGVDLNDAGEVVLRERPSLQTLDYVKRGLDDVIEKYRDPTSGRLQLDTRGNALNDLRQQLVAQLDSASPTFAAARAAYAGPTREREALQKGAKALNASADQIRIMTERMNPTELEQFRLGFRSAIEGMLQSRTDGGNKVAALFNSPKKREAIERVFGGRQGFQNFVATLADEARAAETYRQVMTNSPTANRLADDAMMQDQGLLEQSVGRILRGSQSGTAGLITEAVGMLRDLNRYGAGEAGKRVRQEVAALLSETDPAAFQAIMREVRRQRAAQTAASRRAAVSAQRAGTVTGKLTGNALGNIGPESEPTR